MLVTNIGEPFEYREVFLSLQQMFPPKPFARRTDLDLWYLCPTDHELETWARDLGPTDHDLEIWARELGPTGR